MPPALTNPAVKLKGDFVFQAPGPDLFFRQNFAGEGDVSLLRSTQQVRHPLVNAQGAPIGYVHLSEGPAYGQQIVASAAQGLVVAGLIAIVLAALVGFWVSRQLTAPLAHLTALTAQMAAGNLSVRATLARQDELGVLAHSFNEMAQRVEDTVFALRRFVADAAHELNTPLTALRTNLELEPPSRLGEHHLEQVARLEALVKNLLLLSRLDATNTATEVEQVPAPAMLDLTALVRQVCEPYASRAEQLALIFTLDAPESVIEMTGNRTLLLQAFANLLDNALKFTRPGDTVHVHLQHTSASIQLVIEDSGIGLLDVEVPLLFNRFYRASNAAAYPGNGLGLAIVKAIVEQHGGQVWAEKQSQGMRFVIAWQA